MIQVQQTPNPDSLKFLSEKQILVGSVQEYKKNDLEKIKINFIRELLSFEGVELILVSEKFISVNKDNQTSWDVLKPTIVSHINDYIAKNKLPINNNDKEFKMSGGEQLRDYLPVEEVAKQIFDLYHKNKDGIHNICSGQPISIKKLVNNHLKKRNSRININFGFFPYDDNEPMEFWGIKNN